jgi:hypothetical protein
MDNRAKTFCAHLTASIEPAAIGERRAELTRPCESISRSPPRVSPKERLGIIYGMEARAQPGLEASMER